MKIAIISDLTGFSWAGCEELWAALAERAVQQGHRVAFFQTRQSVAAEKIAPLQALGLELIPPRQGSSVLHTVSTRVSWKLANIAAPWFASTARMKEFAPDIVFLNLGAVFPRPDFVESLKRSGALDYPYVLMCHNSYLFEKPGAVEVQRRAAGLYRGARCVFFAADRTRREAEHLLATEIPNTVDVRYPVNLTDTSAVPMPSGATMRIASVGRLAVSAKGQDTLFAALGSKAWRERDWTLSLYGDGPHRQHLQEWAEHYRIADRVFFKGHVRDVRAIWAENHILALPSRNESAPLVVVEAMLCGRPVVANDVGGIREWIEEAETGFVSPGIDIESFAAALERAWSARSEWEAIGLRARQKALSRIDPDPGDTVLTIFKRLTGLD